MSSNKFQMLFDQMVLNGFKCNPTRWSQMNGFKCDNLHALYYKLYSVQCTSSWIRCLLEAIGQIAFCYGNRQGNAYIYYG